MDITPKTYRAHHERLINIRFIRVWQGSQVNFFPRRKESIIGSKFNPKYLRDDFTEDDDGHGGADDSHEAGGQGVQQDGQGVVDQDVALERR